MCQLLSSKKKKKDDQKALCTFQVGGRTNQRASLHLYPWCSNLSTINLQAVIHTILEIKDTDTDSVLITRSKEAQKLSLAPEEQAFSEPYSDSSTYMSNPVVSNADFTAVETVQLSALPYNLMSSDEASLSTVKDRTRTKSQLMSILGNGKPSKFDKELSTSTSDNVNKLLTLGKGSYLEGTVAYAELGIDVSQFFSCLWRMQMR